MPAYPDLPIVQALPALLTVLATATRVILEAPPGAGKTTLVPLALLEVAWGRDQKILVLEPRRLAARAAATRMARLLDEEVGQTVGYRVRLESRVSARTRIYVVTEGILTRMLQDDPALEGFAAVLFDEFHERSLQADLGLALALNAQAVLRPELRLLLMSATLDSARLAPWLGGAGQPPAPVVRSDGRLFPVETVYTPPAAVAAAGSRPADRLTALAPAAIARALREHATGDILVFLPGLADQRRVAERLALGADVDLHILHGELPLEQQDAALRAAPAGRRKVVLATSIAETSLTIEGVRVVIDGGYARVPRYEPRAGLTTLATEPVSQAAADQRRGRAGRLGPGVCYRLWSAADHAHLPAQAVPEIRQADLSALALETALWGTAAETLAWLDPPPPTALAQARDLLTRLGALTLTRPTPHGRALAALGLAPRLGHLVLRGASAGYGSTAAALAAILAERDLLAGVNSGAAGAPGTRFEAVNPDLRLRLEALATGRSPLPGLVPDRAALARVREAATALRRRAGLADAHLQPDAAGLLAALAYPDRLAQRESAERVRLLSGQRVLLPEHFFSASDQFFAVATLEGSGAAGAGLARAGLAAPVSLAEIEAEFAPQIETADEVRFDAATGRVTARRRRRLGALVLAEANLANPAPALVRAALLTALQTAGAERLPWPEEAAHLRVRLAFAHYLRPTEWLAVDDETLTAELPDWLGPYLPPQARSLADVARADFAEALLGRLAGGWAQRQELDRLAPSHLVVPSGSNIRLDYTEPATPVLAVRLQEVFGLLDTPTVGGAARIPLLLHLLSPARRPVQVTRDLRSFWEKGYFEVRKDLRGRYPKHHWPENPLDAPPTARAKPRGT